MVLAAMGAWAAAPPNLERALEAQRSLVEKQPANSSARVDLGNLLLLGGDTAGAEAAYRKAVELDPTKVAAHFNLGLLLQRNGENSHALKEYKAVLEVDPGHAWAHYRTGEIQESRGLHGTAVKSYAKAFALDPTLRFPDVNPSVIDNHLLTESLLRAYSDYSAERQPPVVFAEPGRIAALLIAPREAAAIRAADAAPAAAPTRQGSTAPSTAAPSAATAAAAKDPAFVRVLGAQDLEPGARTGQVAGGSAARPGYGNDPRNVYYPPPIYVAPPTPEQDPEGNPENYRSGTPSTGRLDLKLYHRRPNATLTARAAG
jgi:tetratricopeptide (TPR) repeat protein